MPVLPADRGIDHRQERGRHHEERKAAVIGRGRVAREVADDSAADRNDGGLAIRREVVQRIVESGQLRGDFDPSPAGTTAKPVCIPAVPRAASTAVPCAAVFVSATTRASFDFGSAVRANAPTPACPVVIAMSYDRGPRFTRTRLHAVNVWEVNRRATAWQLLEVFPGFARAFSGHHEKGERIWIRC